MSRKSQMAIFMILGIVAVLLIGLAYYGVSQATTSSLKSGKSQMEELFVGKGKYTTYIKSCLDQATKQALLLAGQQGGAIYNDEVIGGKPVASSRFYLLGAARIHYALNAPSAPTKSSSAMLAYPYYDVAALPTKPYLNTDVKTYSTSQSYTPFYSIPDPMVALCDGFGKNSENGIGAQYVYCSNFDSNVDPSIHNSVQQYLQNYIAKKTD